MSKKLQNLSRKPRDMQGEPKRIPASPVRGFAAHAANGNTVSGPFTKPPSNPPAPTATPTAPRSHFLVPNGGVPGSASAPAVQPTPFEERIAAKRKGK